MGDSINLDGGGGAAGPYGGTIIGKDLHTQATGATIPPDAGDPSASKSQGVDLNNIEVSLGTTNPGGQSMVMSHAEKPGGPAPAGHDGSAAIRPSMFNKKVASPNASPDHSPNDWKEGGEKTLVRKNSPRNSPRPSPKNTPPTSPRDGKADEKKTLSPRGEKVELKKNKKKTKEPKAEAAGGDDDEVELEDDGETTAKYGKAGTTAGKNKNKARGNAHAGAKKEARKSRMSQAQPALGNVDLD